MSKQEFLNDVKKVVKKLGYFPSTREYERLGKYTKDIIYKFFKSWSDVKTVLKIEEPELNQPIELPDNTKVIQYIKKEAKTLEDFCNKFNLSPAKAKELISNLIQKGYKIKQFDDGQFLLDIQPNSYLVTHSLNIKPIQDTLTFAVVADTHLGSIHDKIEELQDFYTYANQEYGIVDFFHCGDLVAGIHMYRGQNNELKVWGADAQVDYFVENYPKIEGCTTHFITGNHDLCYLNISGQDIGTDIADKRDDMVYLGQYSALINIDKIKIEILHPDCGPAYALSYPAQKIVENIPGGQKPQMLFAGHLHQSMYLPNLRNISVFMCGCFEGQSLWLRRKKLQPAIGGWIIQVGITDDGSIKSVKATWISYFEGRRIVGGYKDGE